MWAFLFDDVCVCVHTHTHMHTDQIYEAGTFVTPRGHSSIDGRLKYIFCDFLN
jgi:hypothetical protein